MGRPGSVYFVPDSYTHPPPGDKEYSAGIEITSTRQTISKLFGALLWQLLELLWLERRTGPLRTPPPSHEQGSGPAPPQGQGDQRQELSWSRQTGGRSGSWSRRTGGRSGSWSRRTGGREGDAKAAGFSLLGLAAETARAGAGVRVAVVAGAGEAGGAETAGAAGAPKTAGAGDLAAGKVSTKVLHKEAGAPGWR